jgi:hypothetical protein
MITPKLYFSKIPTRTLTALVISMFPIFCAMAQESVIVGANLQPGYILVVDAVGDAKILTPEKPKGAIAATGMNLRIGDTVVTSAGARVGLAFSNGSLFEVSENSKFSVQEYLQEPWKFSAEEWRTLEAEPTKSRTKAFIEYGELVVKVRTLAADSSMQISSPLGVAGIRGTTFRVRVARNPDGSTRSVTVQLVEGRVDFIPQGTNEATTVTPGSSITVNVTTGPDGQILIPPSIEERLAPDETTNIQEIIQRLLEKNETLGSFGDAAVQTQRGSEDRPAPAEEPVAIPQNLPPAPSPTPAPTAPVPTPTPIPSGL